MKEGFLDSLKPENNTTPRCSWFGKCGGCQLQHIPYQQQLKLKKETIEQLAHDYHIQTPIDDVVESPLQYGYRHRIDLTARRFTRPSVTPWKFGFVGHDRTILPITQCPIAMDGINELLPQLDSLLPTDTPHHRANVTLKTDSHNHTVFGGIGKKSCFLPPHQYLQFKYEPFTIFYSLDTFFQANLSILPLLHKKLLSLLPPNPHHFIDLYGGVGLFSVFLGSLFSHVTLIEHNPSSTRIAQLNFQTNQLPNARMITQNCEDALENLLNEATPQDVFMIDPPRKGLSDSVCHMLSDSHSAQHLLYLSCNPKSLFENLATLTQKGHWKPTRIIPFDFFPQTDHIETLVQLYRD